MSKRTFTVLRFNGMQFTFDEEIGSSELDAKLQQVWDSYIKFPNAEVHLATGLPSIKPAKEANQISILSNKSLGFVPVMVMWMEAITASNDSENGSFIPNIFHKQTAFLGRMEVEQKLTPLRLV